MKAVFYANGGGLLKPFIGVKLVLEETDDLTPGTQYGFLEHHLEGLGVTIDLGPDRRCYRPDHGPLDVVIE